MRSGRCSPQSPYRRTCIELIALLLLFAGVRYGEYQQVLAAEGLRSYTWMQGHLSGFCFSSQWSVTAMLLLRRYHIASLPALCVPLSLSLHEWFPIIAPDQGIADIQDTWCYFAGYLLAYLILQISRNPVGNNLTSGPLPESGYNANRPTGSSADSPHVSS